MNMVHNNLSLKYILILIQHTQDLNILPFGFQSANNTQINYIEMN